MAQAQQQFSNFEEYLDYDDGTDNLCELFNGELIKVRPESGLNIEIAETKTCGLYHHQIMGQSYPKVAIVTVQDIIKSELRLNVPLSIEVLKYAQRKPQEDNHLPIFLNQITEAV
jgi:hypothetical protein